MPTHQKNILNYFIYLFIEKEILYWLKKWYTQSNPKGGSGWTRRLRTQRNTPLRKYETTQHFPTLWFHPTSKNNNIYNFVPYNILATLIPKTYIVSILLNLINNFRKSLLLLMEIIYFISSFQFSGVWSIISQSRMYFHIILSSLH